MNTCSILDWFSHIFPMHWQHICNKLQQKQYFISRIQQQQTKETKPTAKNVTKPTLQRPAATSDPGEGHRGVYRICICTLQHTGFLLLLCSNSNTHGLLYNDSVFYILTRGNTCVKLRSRSSIVKHRVKTIINWL